MVPQPLVFAELELAFLLELLGALAEEEMPGCEGFTKGQKATWTPPRAEQEAAPTSAQLPASSQKTLPAAGCTAEELDASPSSPTPPTTELLDGTSAEAQVLTSTPPRAEQAAGATGAQLPASSQKTLPAAGCAAEELEASSIKSAGSSSSDEQEERASVANVAKATERAHAETVCLFSIMPGI
jgi:hypothetical protein